ncbi:hypothetical protein C2R22_21975 (plasmid) [Salinigranum rubrum]|uniref:histidine kinase n=1 Tax=Salinigranum rubrum TaxID=755307 RepID=A0A2I8VQN2_9EURY|nr:hypothetical protein C2R22_21975 [Salinigranum rubrum]
MHLFTEAISAVTPGKRDVLPSAERIKILHVDDESSFIDMTSTFLERQSERFHITAETDATDGLTLLTKDNFDCIVSDYRMPTMSGLEFLKRVRSDYPRIPFILFTGQGSEEVASEAISLGVTDYLQKERGIDQFTVLANRIENAVARVRAEQAVIDYKQQLELRDQELERMLAATPDAVIIVDERGSIQQANSAAAKLFGYSRPELLSMPVEQLLPEPYRGRHVSQREGYMQDPEPRPMGAGLDLYALRSDGETFPVEISLGPLHMEDDTRIMATIADITERKRREEELQRQNKRLDEFASIVSHDLRSPLSLATGNLELVRAEHESEAVERIEAALDRMDALIDDLLTFARQGSQVIDSSSVQLTEVVDTAWHTAGTNTATLRVSDDLDTIVCDENRVIQLLENLFRNAIKYGGSDVTVHVGPLDSGFYIADDGPGVPYPSERRSSRQATQPPRTGPDLGWRSSNRSSTPTSGRFG